MAQLKHVSDVVALTEELVNIPSESFHEAEIADAVEATLRGIGTGVEVVRVSNTVAARTHLGLPRRVILAGHLDTVPAADNLPAWCVDGVLHGLGSVDMKSGDAVFLHVFSTLCGSASAAEELSCDVTVIFYEREEVAAQYSGIGELRRAYPDWFAGDFAILGEPTGGLIEAGCQGSLRVKVTARGVRAHSARAWLGDNALHKLGPILTRIAADPSREVTLDGCTYREGLNAVVAHAGVATNTIPDEATCFVNFRYAPDRTSSDALAHLLAVVAGVDAAAVVREEATEAIAAANQLLEERGAGLELELDDLSPAAPPSLNNPLAGRLIEILTDLKAGQPGGEVPETVVRAKFGWTDVARFAEMGIPAINCGPGDPAFAHKPDEQCPVEQILTVAAAVRKFLTR